jgi:hypothetical protein
VSSESDDPEDGEIVEDTAKTPNFGMGPEKEEASILQLNQTASNSKAHVPTRGGFGFRDQIVRNDGESSSNNMTRGDDWRRGRGAQLGTSASIPLPQQESPGKIEEEEGNNPYEMISTDKKTVIKVVTSVREKMAVCRKVQGKCAWFMLYERGTFVECRQTLLRLLLFYH